jgi:hypothetical protein
MHQIWCNNSGPWIALAKCKSHNWGRTEMWIEKLSSGVLKVLTPLGPRYIKPSFFARLYLMWMFRNFPNLPAEVLSGHQKRLIDRLCSEQRFVSQRQMNPLEDAPLLGTLESRPVAPSDATLSRRPSASVREEVVPFAADGQNRL